MEPRDNAGPHGHVPKDHVEVSNWALLDIRTSLSVICGRVQLLQRRLHRGHPIDDADLLQALGCIHQAARTVEARLREADGTAGHKKGDADRE